MPVAVSLSNAPPTATPSSVTGLPHRGGAAGLNGDAEGLVEVVDRDRGDPHGRVLGAGEIGDAVAVQRGDVEGQVAGRAMLSKVESKIAA
jgi:hypothetical protein